MNFWCWLLGHKWNYNFVYMPTKRTCKRCGEKEKTEFNPNFVHPIRDDMFLWIKEK